MSKLITGLHHVTAMASGAQKNVDFYAGVLGLHLVKKTVNFDAPDVYHLYYGDENGSPGSIMTFFPFKGIQPGRHGKGQVATTSLSIPLAALDYWLARLDTYKIPHKNPQQRFDEVFVYLEDPDGLGLELVANDHDDRPGFTYGNIPLEYSIRGFYGVELWENTYERTEALLERYMDHTFLREEGSRRRYSSGEGKPGQFVDIIWDANSRYGAGGSGTVHHVAFNTPSDADQLALREKLLSAGYDPTPVVDRQYFHSVYYREPGGVLFEVATLPPGFAYDEPADQLGTSLKLPEWYEPRRSYLEKLLEPITLDIGKYA
jgi:glyoxalase family protein